MCDYQKLVRDNIPEIIRENNEIPLVKVLGDKEYENELDDKLVEEVDEFLESGDLEELADVLEVINAICDYKGVSFSCLEDIRRNKRNERGGFENRIYLEDVH